MFALVDCNNFFASCERLFQPWLNDKPVVVLSNNDGCVIARSNEAKDLGIKMGDLAFEKEQFFEKHRVHVFSSNYTLYGDLSSRVMNTLGKFAPEIEVYSIDEAFLSFKGAEHLNLKEIGERMRIACGKGIGIPISVGFGNTKTLSKVANKIAKKYPIETGGVHIIDSEEKRIKALKWLKVEDVWGIGRKYSKWLNSIGIYTAYDFSMMSDSAIRKRMSVVGLRTKKELQGIPCIELEEVQKDKKMICVQHGFGSLISELSDLEEALGNYCRDAVRKLRKQNLATGNIVILLATHPFRQDLPQYRNSISIKLETEVFDILTITKKAMEGLKRIYKEGYGYKRVGILLTELKKDSMIQTNLFEEVDLNRAKALQKAYESINTTFGKEVIRVCMAKGEKKFKLKRERLSPCYTTRWEGVIEVH